MKIKPCPFCGGEAIVEKTDVAFFRVRCKECACDIGRHWFMVEDKAIEAWNRREPMDKIVEQLEDNSLCANLNAFEFSMSKYAEPRIVDERSYGEFRAYETAINIVKGASDETD